MAAGLLIGFGSKYWTWTGEAIIGTLALYLLLNAILYLRRWIWIPWTAARQLRRQGYSGPPFTCFTDNSREIREMVATAASKSPQSISHDFHARVFPHIHAWTKLYGPRFIFSPMRGIILVNSADPRVIKEVFFDPVTYEKTQHNKFLTDLVGSGGLVFARHDKWTKQRRVVRPMFYPSKSREMVTEMASWIVPWLGKLETLVVENGGAIDMDIVREVGELAKDILARSSFGSSFVEGKDTFDNQLKLRQLLVQTAFTPHLTRFLPASVNRYLPTSLTRKIWKAKRQLANSLLDIIQARRDSVETAAGSGPYGDDLLGVLLAANETHKSPKEKWTDIELMDQCKTFFAAGSETVHLTIAWCIMLLAHHQDWQERIRAEVRKVFEGASPDGKKLGQLKLLQMFVDETLRLYPPAPQTHRLVVRDNVTILGEPVPKYLNIRHDILAIHQDTELWGDDALEFKPERFARGVAKACKELYAYLPFGAGPRSCVAQPFALTEVKLTLAMVVERFSLTLSPSYRHEPVWSISLMPKFGVQVILELLQ